MPFGGMYQHLLAISSARIILYPIHRLFAPEIMLVEY